MNDKADSTWPPVKDKWPFCSNSYPADAPESLEEFFDEGRSFAMLGILGSKSTQRAYAGDWQRFVSWCEAYRVLALPVDPSVLSMFLVHLAETKKVATIQRYLAAIGKTHDVAELPNPVHANAVKQMLRGITLELGVFQKLAPAFSLKYFKECILSIDVSKPSGLRDRALLLLGYAGAFRCSELANIDIHHLEWCENDLLIRIPRSKTNQRGEIEHKAFFFSEDPRVCPIRAVQAWLELLRAHNYIDGPLFVSFHKGNRLSRRRLSTYRLNLMVKERLGTKFTAHSLRVSFITNAKIRGASDDEIMNQSKHRTRAMIGHYTRHDSTRQCNYSILLGL